MTVGIDEVGRGAWAGPLLVCAARLKKGKKHPLGLKDSKKLTKLQREELFIAIKECYYIGEGWISNDVLDHLGLSHALKCGVLSALQQLSPQPNDDIVIDGNVNYCNATIYKNARSLVKADDTVAEVSAASIYAKVLRDNFMAELDREFASFGFRTNVGYGTAEHRKALKENGPTRLHRKSFKIL